MSVPLYFPKNHAVAHRHVKGNSLAVVHFACAYGNDFSFLRFLFGRVGHDDASPHGFLLLGALHEDSVV
jgi:hypothetical protein